MSITKAKPPVNNTGSQSQTPTVSRNLENSSRTSPAAPARAQSAGARSAINSGGERNGNDSQAGRPEDSTTVSPEARSKDLPGSGVSGLLSGVSDWAAASPEQSDSQPAAEAGQASGPSSQDASLSLTEGETLGRSSSPEQITRLQEMLNARGGELQVDGAFGPLTTEAVRRFQRENNLTVDGVVGPQTLAALNRGQEGEGSGDSSGQAGVVQRPTGEAIDPSTRVSPGGESADTRQAGAASTLQGLPPRADDALGGRAFMESIQHLPPGADRNRAILDEILGGNIPPSSRNLQELTVTRPGPDGREREIRMNVMADYLSIGSDEDNVRVPMTPAVAQAIADRTGTSLPTDRIVDDIHSQARRLHLDPFTWREGPQHARNMQSIGHYQMHDQRIDEQLGSGAAQSDLVSGHKKDIVIPARDGRVAIYGGAWPNGGRVQSYSNVHGDYYEDYSHGARLVSQEVSIDGQTMQLSEALADPTLAPLFTNQRSGSFRY